MVISSQIVSFRLPTSCIFKLQNYKTNAHFFLEINEIEINWEIIKLQKEDQLMEHSKELGNDKRF